MAECEKMMELCEESIDRTLTPEEQELLEQHLSVCPSCAAYLADLQFMTAAFAEEPAFPDSLHASIMAGITEEASRTVIQTHRPNRTMPVLALFAAAAACVVLVLSGALGDLLYNLDLSLAGGGSSGSSAGAAPAANADNGFDAGAGYAADTDAAAAPAAEDGSASADIALYAEESEEDIPAADPMEGRSSKAARSAEPSPEGLTSEDSNDLTGSIVSTQTQMLQPQIAAFISNVMEGEVFAACYLVEGGADLPEIGQVQQRDEHFGYYAADNSPAQLETLLDSLEKAGCTVQTYEEAGVLFNEDAHRVIIVVRLD